ncbi:hypothetical protein BV898_05394 [Hypsibius exemplaris]|uniref:Uncharacterized protein n=1 Tax=Hypsibius exemplaris TaxID=2072580 RepID=A0A1W0WZS2_HYPEX|nr:hypothetical protein BV898_05394 [Hypsibius exemplaris]
MAFPLLLTLITITPTLDCQLKYYKAVLEGTVKLPSTEEMVKNMEDDYRERMSEGDGLNRLVAHGMGEKLWGYLEELGGEAGFEPYEPATRKLSEAAFRAVRTDTATFKNDILQRVDSENILHIKQSVS